MEFTPAVYEHAASFLRRTPWEVSRDGSLLTEAHSQAFAQYAHAPMVVGIDIYNVEAEAYGAVVVEPEGTLPPSIEDRLCTDIDDILDLPALEPERAGRFPMILQSAAELARRYPEAHVRIPLSGPFSIASTLLGFEPLLYAMLADPARAARALDHLARGQSALARAAAAMGLEVLLFESGAAPPLLSPGLFREVVFPSLRTVMGDARQAAGARIGCIVGGNTVPILDLLLATEPAQLICPVETDRTAFMDAMQGSPEVTVRINTPPEIYLHGPWERIEEELSTAAALARGRKRAIIGTGVLAYETDPALVLRAGAFARSLNGHPPVDP